MDSFEVLEKKVVKLIELTHKLQNDNATLTKENNDLQKRLNALEADLDKNSQVAEQEKEKTKVFVADIIKNIDQLVESNG